MITVLEIAGPVVVCGGFFAAFVRTFCTTPPEEQAGPNAWIDAAIAAETHPGRQAALRMLRNNDPEAS